MWHDLLGGHPHVGAAVTLGSPHAGFASRWLRWAPPPLAELASGSVLHRRLAAAHAAHTNWTSIAGRIDWVVPPAVTHLEGARHETVGGVGHSGLLYSRAAAGLVSFALLAAEEEAAV